MVCSRPSGNFVRQNVLAAKKLVQSLLHIVESNPFVLNPNLLGQFGNVNDHENSRFLSFIGPVTNLIFFFIHLLTFY